MNSALVILMALFIVFLYEKKQKDQNMLKHILKQISQEERTQMLEFARRFVGKECVIYTFNSTVTGVVKEVSEGGILLQGINSIEVINLDLVVRIREYPLKKNGKKKAFIG